MRHSWIVLVAACAPEIEPGAEPAGAPSDWIVLDESDELPIEPSIEVDGKRAVLPSRTVYLEDGSTLSFYLFEDGSVGMRGEGDAAATVLPLLEERVGESPAEAWWAVTAPGTPMPEAFLTIHDEMVATGERPALEEAITVAPQGWMLHDVPLFRYAPCVNTTYETAHCLPKAPYNHDSCSLDSNTNHFWHTAAILRYHAAMCLDAGTVDDTLTYSILAEPDECLYFASYNEIWGPVIGTSPYSANTYLWWVWIAPAGGSRRSWTHDSDYVGGADNLDWSIMQVTPGTCG